MKIGILSDTHDNLPFIERALAYFQKEGISVLIHCGDATKPETLSKCKDFTVYAVKGNNDRDIEGFRQLAKEMKVKWYDDYADLVLENRRIAVIHSDDHFKFGSLLDSFSYDYLCYGHTHQAICQKLKNTWLVNPGAHDTNTIAIIDLEKNVPEIVKLNNI